MADREEWLNKPRGNYKLADILRDVTKPAVDKRGQLEGQILAYWSMIAGDDIAAQCTPSRVIKSKTQSFATIEITVTSGDSLALQHQEPLILERIATFFGYRAIQRIRWQQMPMDEQGEPAQEKPIASPPKKASINARKCNPIAIEDESLRNALHALETSLEENQP